MEHTPIERKLITLALDPAAHDGEVANATAMLLRSLRTRAVTAQQFSSNSSGNEYALRDRINKLNQTINDLNQTIKELNQTINNQAQLIRLLDEERMHRRTPPPLPVTPPPLPQDYVTSVDKLFKQDRWHEVDREENLRRWSKEAREDTWFEKMFGR
jgi:uncharacterized protein YukE